MKDQIKRAIPFFLSLEIGLFLFHTIKVSFIRSDVGGNLCLTSTIKNGKSKSKENNKTKVLEGGIPIVSSLVCSSIKILTA